MLLSKKQLKNFILCYINFIGHFFWDHHKEHKKIKFFYECILKFSGRAYIVYVIKVN